MNATANIRSPRIRDHAGPDGRLLRGSARGSAEEIGSDVAERKERLNIRDHVPTFPRMTPSSGFDDLWHCQGYRRPRTVHPMESILTIASYATVICPVVLIGLLWRLAKRADEAETEAPMPPRDSPERRKK
jgi:hypothetical protein